jgi:multisubunit Na+/H+ antiporter MnhB subunit
VIGTPVLLWYLRRNDGDPADLGFLALKITAVAFVLTGLIAAAVQNEQIFTLSLLYTVMGIIFGPIWAYFFGWLYQKMRRDFFAKPRSA